MADLRFSHPDYLNDQVWSLSSGSPAIKGLVLETTFGIRVNWMRYFPRFLQEMSIITDPDEFTQPVRIEKQYVNYLKIIFSPFEGIETTAEYWVPDSHCVSGRFTFKNLGEDARKFGFEWVGMFNPMGEGSGLNPIKKNSSYILQGRADNLAPVCFLSGGPVPGTGSLPSLILKINLEPGQSQSCIWSNATLPNTDASFNHAKSLSSKLLDDEFTRIERINAWNRVEIHTSNDVWDDHIRLTQNFVYGLFFPGNQNLPEPTFVLARNPDLGYSYKGDGTDYPYSWSGQSLMDAYFLSGIVPPNNIDLIKGLVENFLYIQGESGFIDAHPGLAGQRSNFLAPPLLAVLAGKIYRHNQDKSWLSKIFPGLVRFFKCWTDTRYDKDRDGLPEWQSLSQTGLEYHPWLDPWFQGSKGIDIQYLESPALIAFLLKEGKTLLRISKELQDESDYTWLNEKIELFERSLAEFWSEKNRSYLYRDFQSHNHHPGSALVKFSGPGVYQIGKKTPLPMRLLLSVTNIDENTRTLLVTISGVDEHGNLITEKITSRNATWIFGKACYTTKNLFSVIDQVSIVGSQSEIPGELSSIDTDFEDISLLLPLWVRLLPDSIDDDLLFEKINNDYLTDQGLVSYLSPTPPNQKFNNEINPVWNLFILEGLLQNNQRNLAVKVLTHYLNSLEPGKIGVVSSHWGYALPKLVPIELFLRIIGIRKLTRKDIILEGYSPLPDPVIVKFEGITIVIKGQEYQITTQDGESIKITGPGAHRVEIE